MQRPPTPLAIEWEKVADIRRRAQKLQVATQTAPVVVNVLEWDGVGWHELR